MTTKTVSDSPSTGTIPPPASLNKPKAGPGALRRIAPLIVLIAIAAIAFLVWKTFFASAPAPANVILLSGRIEGDGSSVGVKTAGRILEIRVREGDNVNAGDTIAIMDDAQVKAREDRARAAVSEAEARATSAQNLIAVLEENLRQDQLRTEQAKVEAEGRVRQAEADVAAAEAELARQEAAYQLALFDKDAYAKLAETGAVSERRGKEAATTAAQQAAAVTSARRRVEATRGALTLARATLSNPGIRSSEAAAVRKQIAQQQSEIVGAAAGIEQARAQLREAEANRQDLIVTAPFSGTITTRAAEPGEVVQAGTAIVTLLDLTTVYLRGFVPEGQIGNVKVGQPARVYLDSAPNRPIEASVSRIDPEATFTPENTYFRDDRVKQVVGIKLNLKGATGFAKPGMPADGKVLIQGETWPPE